MTNKMTNMTKKDFRGRILALEFAKMWVQRLAHKQTIEVDKATYNSSSSLMNCNEKTKECSVVCFDSLMWELENQQFEWNEKLKFSNSNTV